MSDCNWRIWLLIFISIYILEIDITDSFVSDSTDEEQLSGEQIKSLIIVIISQSNFYHHMKATRLQQEIHVQSEKIFKARPVVHLSHIDFPHVGAWTYLPLIPHLLNQHENNGTGVLFLQDDTVLDIRRFMDVMTKFLSLEYQFIGHALHDREPSIIHHFAFYEDTTQFEYPNQASGFYVNMKLLTALNDRMKEGVKTDFNIDASHELALFIWNEGNGTSLNHEETFCTAPPTGPATECAIYPRLFEPCENEVSLDEIYFAVKTCQKFHVDRLKVVRSTWAQYVRHIRYFSDYSDENIPTIDTGIPNTDVGHCEKTFAILQYALNDIKSIAATSVNMLKIKWIVLVDDDTILSVSHMLRLLSCYNPEEGVVLGERYGYGVGTHKGYNYITGGGGTVISHHLLPQLAFHCSCPSARTPDDMYLGFCLRELGQDIVHSPLFHQARPNDYPKEYLKSHERSAVSFHKHWMVDPIKIYKTWFQQADVMLDLSINHQEL